MDKEDYLLKQIDEFREKAKKLQKQLVVKEDRLNELEAAVGQKEQKSKELETAVAAKRKEANRVTQQAREELDQMIAETEKLFAGLVQSMEARQAELTESFKALETEWDETIRTMSTEVGETVKGTQEELLAQTNRKFDETIEAVKECSVQMNRLKNDIGEKIHAENVKCYRNIKNLVDDTAKDMTEELSVVEVSDESVQKVKSPFKWVIALGVINFILVVLDILCDMGIFQMLGLTF